MCKFNAYAELMKYKNNTDEIIKINKELQIPYMCCELIIGFVIGLIVGSLI